MLKLFPRPELLNRVSMTKLRPHLREVIEAIHAHNSKFLITHHGHQVAAIVSIQDFWRIWEDEDLDLLGPKHPQTGKRPGPIWVRESGWQRHLAVEWTEAGPVVKKGYVAKIPEEAAQAPQMRAPERRRWWALW